MFWNRYSTECRVDLDESPTDAPHHHERETTSTTRTTSAINTAYSSTDDDLTTATSSSAVYTTPGLSPIHFSCWNSMGPIPTQTPTRTLGMRLSCNFVNGIHNSLSCTVHVYTCIYMHASLTDILARKSTRVGQVGGQAGKDCRACPARGKLNGVAGHAYFRVRILAWKSARMSVSVSVPWNLNYTGLALSSVTPLHAQTPQLPINNNLNGCFYEIRPTL